MKQGDKVKIYQKPLSEKEFEGEAKLVKKISKFSADYGSYMIEDWIVKFEDGVEVRRTIKIIN